MGKLEGTNSPSRGRGRPIRDGRTVEEAQTHLLDAAERLMERAGYAALTMAAVAQEGGYSRGGVYRYFATRDDLIDALVVRAATGQLADTAPRLMSLPDWAEVVTESMVIVATETSTNPLLRTIVEHDGHGTVADLVLNSPGLTSMMSTMYEALFKTGGRHARDGLRPSDAARYVLTVVLGLLSGTIPGSDDPEQVRRYVRVFVLPALVNDPPKPTAVFAPL